MTEKKHTNKVSFATHSERIYSSAETKAKFHDIGWRNCEKLMRQPMLIKHHKSGQIGENCECHQMTVMRVDDYSSQYNPEAVIWCFTSQKDPLECYFPSTCISSKLQSSPAGTKTNACSMSKPNVNWVDTQSILCPGYTTISSNWNCSQENSAYLRLNQYIPKVTFLGTSQDNPSLLHLYYDSMLSDKW